MYVEKKSSRNAGAFWLITFEDKADKRDTLNELRLMGNHLSKSGKDDLYHLIRKISKGYRHDERYQHNEELAVCLFDSDITDVILFMSVFASVVKDQSDILEIQENTIKIQKEIIDSLKEQIDYLKEIIPKSIEIDDDN